MDDKKIIGGDQQFHNLLNKLRDGDTNEQDWEKIVRFIDEELFTESELDNRCVIQFDQGVARGKAITQEIVLNKAAEFFKQGKDTEAQLLRQLSKDIK